MEKLSKNLSLSEVIKSNTAIKRGIDNTPTPEHLENLKVLAENVFQPVRDALGTISVSSGYRSKDLNRAIGGSKTSQHCSGEALDLDNDHKTGRATNKEIFDYIRENLVFDQMISEFGTKENPSWIHVSFKKSGMNRKEVLRAYKKNGRTIYAPYTD